jgi:hypothetical protein
MILDAIDEKFNSIEICTQQLEEIKQALMQDLLT